MTDTEKMNMDYKISVIVPVFRVEKYLNRCVDSILNQDYKNLEVVLVDDGSDDNCPKLCDEYEKADNRVKVIHRKNGGLSAARNSGIEAATGDIIALVDSDDYINTHMFSDLMTNMLKYNADIAMCDYMYVSDNESQRDISIRNELPEIQIFNGREIQYCMYESYRNRVNYTVAWNKLYKKELFAGITYPEGRIHEDEAKTHELLYLAKRIVHVKAPYYYYFQRDDSIVGKGISIKRLQLIDAYIDRLSFYRMHVENVLWQKEVTHSMHMMCYLQNLLEKAGVKVEIKKQPQMRHLVKELLRYREISGVSFLKLAEIMLFIHGYSVYYLIWKGKKK